MTFVYTYVWCQTSGPLVQPPENLELMANSAHHFISEFLIILLLTGIETGIDHSPVRGKTESLSFATCGVRGTVNSASYTGG